MVVHLLQGMLMVRAVFLAVVVWALPDVAVAQSFAGPGVLQCNGGTCAYSGELEPGAGCGSQIFCPSNEFSLYAQDVVIGDETCSDIFASSNCTCTTATNIVTPDDVGIAVDEGCTLECSPPGDCTFAPTAVDALPTPGPSSAKMPTGMPVQADAANQTEPSTGMPMEAPTGMPMMQAPVIPVVPVDFAGPPTEAPAVMNLTEPSPTQAPQPAVNLTGPPDLIQSQKPLAPAEVPTGAPMASSENATDAPVPPEPAAPTEAGNETEAPGNGTEAAGPETFQGPGILECSAGACLYDDALGPGEDCGSQIYCPFLELDEAGLLTVVGGGVPCDDIFESGCGCTTIDNINTPPATGITVDEGCTLVCREGCTFQPMIPAPTQTPTASPTTLPTTASMANAVVGWEMVSIWTLSLALLLVV